MSYPKDVHRFRNWAKLMIEGATVDRERTKSYRVPTRRGRKKRRKRRKVLRDA